ncbi:MAG: fibronectin type III domain-containing protein, partial [Muribaculaceae bacterium]|nr:fibronectin type III domain-containing protein [Muribaculaceae bacterium]
PDGKTVATNLSATEFSEPMAAGNKLETYYYSVRAAYAGLNSDPVNSNPVTLGSVVPPYENNFNLPEDLETFNIIDGNGDGYSWQIEGGRAQMIYNKEIPMDDWMISPGLKLEGGKLYYVSLEAASNSTAFAEKLEVKWGAASSADGMTETLIEPTVLDSPMFKELGAYMAPETDGVYYVGLHGISDPDMYYLFVRNFKVGEAQTAGTPGAVTDLKITPSPNGELEATVSFNVPSVGITGLPITSISKVTITRGNTVVKVFDSSEAKLGVKLEYKDVVPAGGTYEYTVQASNEDGDGLIATGSVFIGVAKPAAPQNVMLKEEGNTGRVTISWLPVEKDFEGNPINPAKVKYVIYKHDGEDWKPFTEELSETSYTLQAVPVGQQGFVQYAVLQLLTAVRKALSANIGR